MNIKRCLKKSIIFILSIMVIIFSFVIPKLLFGIEDFAKEEEIYGREKVKSKIDVEAEKIYLVKAIHELYDNEMVTLSETEALYYIDKGEKKVVSRDKNKLKRILFTESTEELYKNAEETQKINNEIKKLENVNILNEVIFNSNTKYSIRYYGTNDSKLRDNQLIKSIDIILEGYDINIEIENKTGKIIMMSLPKDNIKNNIAKEEILENYIKYLDLYIIDDWELKKQSTQAHVKCDYIVSEKSQLLAMIIESDEEYIMSIQTIERYGDLLEELERYNSYTN